jgi:hypothetical protein
LPWYANLVPGFVMLARVALVEIRAVSPAVGDGTPNAGHHRVRDPGQFF